MPPKHQLNIHLDYGPQCFELWGLEVRYGYHYSGEHQLCEQVIRIAVNHIEPALKTDLDSIYESLKSRIPEQAAVRLTHSEVTPKVRPAGLTFVVLDQSRAKALPIARLYYYEEIEPIGSRIERRIYLENPDWKETEHEVCERVQENVRKIAWKDYERLMGHHLFGAAENGA